MLLALLVLALMAAILAAPLVARAIASRRARTSRRRRVPRAAPISYDPGRERRAEQRARQLLRSCVNEEEWAMYRDLGFIRLAGRHRPAGHRATGALGTAARSAGAVDTAAESGHRRDAEPPYAYLIYPHKPILAYVPATAQLLSEYCVEFPDLSGGGATRLPASDDVLAKWMALTSDESRVIGRANMHLVGRQLDPARLRRDLWRLSEWERRRGTRGSVGTRRA
ncbi:MAG: hypothetical protein M3356_01990 [Actinomycetota bacterium]|nr:hypothetical protein [Actinomycetota bacterium]MDQ3644264.1 hypothetical protein [Actinomycetota bacterium]